MAFVLPLCPLCQVDRLHIAIQRKPLRTFPMPWWAKLGLRICYAYMREITLRYGFAASKLAGEAEHNGDFHSLELKGAFVNKADAWHAVNCDAGCVKTVPFNDELPDETCSFGPEDWPALDAKPRRRYQQRRLKTIAIDAAQFEALDAKTIQVLDCAEGRCAKVV